jgi:hypothetical protein
MYDCEVDRGYLARLQAQPPDLRRMVVGDAARALYDFLQEHFQPGEECSIWSPDEAEALGYPRRWRVSWEAGPVEWGVLLSMGESLWLTEFDLRYDHRPEVLLRGADGWYTEPYYRFDVGFIEKE